MSEQNNLAGFFAPSLTDVLIHSANQPTNQPLYHDFF